MEAWIKTSLGRLEPRSSPKCYCCTFIGCSLYSSWATSCVERRLPPARRRARCFFNHVWNLRPRQFRKPAKTPGFWSALSVPRSGGGVWLTVYWLYQGLRTGGPELAAWAPSSKCSFTRSAHRLYLPVCAGVDRLRIMTSSGGRQQRSKKWRNGEKKMQWFNLISLGFTHNLGLIFIFWSLQCKYLSIIIFKSGFVSCRFLRNLLNWVWMSVCVFWEEKDCTASLLLCDHNLFLFSISFLSSFEHCFAPFYPVDQSNRLVSYLLWFCRQVYRHLLVHQDGKIGKKANQIIYKWVGRRASGSNSWPHWASLLLFSFQSIWYECAFTNIYFSSVKWSVLIYFNCSSHAKLRFYSFDGVLKFRPDRTGNATKRPEIPSGTF